MESELKKLLLLMHSKKSPGKTLSGKVCVDAIRQKFSEKFQNVTDWEAVVSEADALFAELDARHRKRSDGRKRQNDASDSSDEDASDASEDDSGADSSSGESDSDDSSEDDSNYSSCTSSDENTGSEEEQADQPKKSAQTTSAGEMAKFLERADVSFGKKGSNESEEEFKARLVEVFENMQMDPSDLSKRALRKFSDRQELMALQEEADIVLTRAERKGRGNFSADAAPQAKRACSSLVDE